MVSISILFVATAFLAYANGANDNFKGVATLFGSGTTAYRPAMVWATATTFAGSLASLMLASGLVKSFSGKGLVPDAIAHGLNFHGAVAFAAGSTVILATVLGFPISTTHALTGALVGAGWAAGWGTGTTLVNLSALKNTFILPLLLSPGVAIVTSILLYGSLHTLSQRLGLSRETCVCVVPAADEGVLNPATPLALDWDGSGTLGGTLDAVPSLPQIKVDRSAFCAQRYTGKILGLQAQGILDGVHFLSAGVVSFARGLNDTPKLLSLVVLVQALPPQGYGLGIGLVMALGGWLSARRVAETMSQKVTDIYPSQGLCANLVTGALVICASRWGLPVSTTHVSVGSIFGGGVISGTAHPQVFLQVLLSWVLTLPIATLLSSLFYSLMEFLT